MIMLKKSAGTRQVPFGLRDGRMVSTEDVPSGEECGCVCPGCLAPLVAKKGETNVHHFAHVGQVCGSGPETAIHLMAKQILVQEKNMELPAMVVELSAVDAFGDLAVVRTTLVDARHIHYSSVSTEVTIGNHRPDALAMCSDGTEHRVEVFVSHAVDSMKAKELEALDAACFEICLNNLPTDISVDCLRAAVISTPERVRWVSYPGISKARLQLAAELELVLATARKSKLDWDVASQLVYDSIAEEERQERLQWARDQRNTKLREQKAANANATFRLAPLDEKRAFLKTKLRIPDGPTPDLVNVRVRGAGSFGVPTDIWQSDVFRKVVFSRGRGEFLFDSLMKWMSLRYVIATENPTFFRVALWDYLMYLEGQRYVRHLGRQKFATLRDTAPWLEHELAISGNWFWAPGAGSCSLAEVEAANDAGAYGISRRILEVVLSSMKSDNCFGGEPDDTARRVAQRVGMSPNILLHVMLDCGVVACPSMRPLPRADDAPFEWPVPDKIL